MRYDKLLYTNHLTLQTNIFRFQQQLPLVSHKLRVILSYLKFLFNKLYTICFCLLTIHYDSIMSSKYSLSYCAYQKQTSSKHEKTKGQKKKRKRRRERVAVCLKRVHTMYMSLACFWTIALQHFISPLGLLAN